MRRLLVPVLLLSAAAGCSSLERLRGDDSRLARERDSELLELPRKREQAVFDLSNGSPLIYPANPQLSR